MVRSISIFFIIIFISFVVGCSTYMKVKVATHVPPQLLEIMKGGKNITIYVDQSDKVKVENWRSIIYGAIENQLQNYGYYKLIDSKNSEERMKLLLDEVKQGQLGLKPEVKELGKESSIDGILFLEIPKEPLSECKRTQQMHTNRKQRCTRYIKKPNGVRECAAWEDYFENYTEYKASLFVTVFLNARLVNIETGKSISYATSSPIELNESSNIAPPDCPSTLKGFNLAVGKSSEDIANHISAKMGIYEVKLMSDAVGLDNDDVKSDVKSYLKKGNKWAETEPPDYELAKKDWEKALNLSAHTSASAFWNLAIYYWTVGDIAKAEEYFNKAKEYGGADWLSSKQMDVMGRFKQEKERLKLEKKE